MEITDNDLVEAAWRAKAMLRWRDVDSQWDRFRQLLEEERERRRESMVLSLALEIVRNTLCPGAWREPRMTRSWNRVLSGQLAAEHFIHDLRLARAVGWRIGKP